MGHGQERAGRSTHTIPGRCAFRIAGRRVPAAGRSDEIVVPVKQVTEEKIVAFNIKKNDSEILRVNPLFPAASTINTSKGEFCFAGPACKQGIDRVRRNDAVPAGCRECYSTARL